MKLEASSPIQAAVATADSAFAQSQEIRVLRARAGWRLLDLSRLWRYREMLLFLAARDIKVRYRQSILGALWAVIQPLGMMIVITLVRQMLGVGGTNDPVLIFAGLLPWMFFAAALTSSTNSLVSNAGMLRKVYFPRLVLPLSAIGAPLVDLGVSLIVLCGLMAWYGTPLTASLFLLPLIIGSAMIASLGIGVLLSALTVRYRDFRHVVPFLVQVMFFLTPVMFIAADLPYPLRWMIGLNPIGGPIEAFRAAILGTEIDVASWLLSTKVAALCLIVGLMYFGRTEKRFADVV